MLTPHQATSAQGSSARKISPQNFWLQNQWGLSQWKKLLESQAVLLKESTHIDFLTLTPSELQHWGSSLKGTSGIREELKHLASRQELKDSFLPDRKAGRGYCPFSEHSTTPPHPPPCTEPQSLQAGAISETPQPG